MAKTAVPTFLLLFGWMNFPMMHRQHTLLQLWITILDRRVYDRGEPCVTICNC